MRNIGAAGLALLQASEGLRLTSYQDSVGVWTIGWGHTGREVKAGQTITKEQAVSLLETDLGKFERGVEAAVKVPLTQNQFDALVCFTYNVGFGEVKRNISGLLTSTLLRLLNSGDYAGAAGQFPRWNKAGGVVLPGLTKRRNAERQLFLS